MRRSCMPNVSTPHLKAEYDSPPVKPPQEPLRERLLVKLYRLLRGEEPGLATHLTTAQLDCIRSLYLSPLPTRSSNWAVRAQHVADGCTALYEALKPEGISRKEFKKILENVRYVDFLHSIENWIDGVKETPPQPLRFDVRSRAHAKEAFAGVLRHLRIPSHLLEVGTLTPVYLPRIGYAVQTTWNDSKVTFLIATPNGSRLTIPRSDRATLRGLVSPNRQLSNLLHGVGPVILERALAPRTILNHGTSRVALFCPTDRDGPYKYLHLPPSVGEKQVVPVVNMENVQAGAKIFHLRGTLSRDVVATIELPASSESTQEPRVRVFSVASPLKQGIPFVDFVTKTTDESPPPLTLEINRRVVSDQYTHLRVLLAGQMTVPAQYPLRRITVHALSNPEGIRYIGLYPPGVAPVSTPPVRAFIRDSRQKGWTPINSDEVWHPDQLFQEEVKRIAKDFAKGTVSASREAWYALHRLSTKEPLKFQSLVLSDANPHSLAADPAVSQLRSAPGWPLFAARIEDEMRESQACSVPYVARLLRVILYGENTRLDRELERFQDPTFTIPTNPIVTITRLAVVAPGPLQRTLNELRDSPNECVATLAAGKERVTDFIAALPSITRRIKDSRVQSPDFENNFLSE